MKTIKRLYELKNLLVLILLIGMSLFFSACAKKTTFAVSTIVPAAHGYVKVNKDKNKNQAIVVKVTNLSSPARLTPPKKEYVVWIVTNDHLTKNIGRLKSSKGVLSKTWTGSLKTVTSFSPDIFFITAEDDANILYPGPTVVLSTMDSR